MRYSSMSLTTPIRNTPNISIFSSTNPPRPWHNTQSKMSDLRMTSKQSDHAFDAHPEGTFMAVCRDIWIDRKPNTKAGQLNQWGNPEPDELVRVVIEFLTDEPIEINGQMMPRFIGARFGHNWNEKGNLRKFITQWDPKMGKSDDADIEELVGRGAYITVTHNPGTDGKVWANITSISAPPKGASVPQVPAEFMRKKYK